MSGNTKAILNAVAGNTYDFSEEVDKKLKEKVAAAIKDEETKVDMDEEKDDEESPLEESAGQILRMMQGMRKTTKDIDRMLTRTSLEKKERMEITNQLWQLRSELGLVEESLDEGALRRESVEYFEEDRNTKRINEIDAERAALRKKIDSLNKKKELTNREFMNLNRLRYDLGLLTGELNQITGKTKVANTGERGGGDWNSNQDDRR